MTDNLYEGMFLLDSGKFASNPEGSANEVISILEKAGGTVVAHRPWQDGRLAYSIEGRHRGLHYLTYFQMEGTKLKDVNRACQLNDNILRHLVIKQPRPLFDAMVAAINQHDTTEPSAAKKTPVEEKPQEDSDNSGDEKTD